MAMSKCPDCGGNVRNGKCLSCGYKVNTPPKGTTSRSGGGPPAQREGKPPPPKKKG